MPTALLLTREALLPNTVGSLEHIKAIAHSRTLSPGVEEWDSPTGIRGEVLFAARIAHVWFFSLAICTLGISHRGTKPLGTRLLSSPLFSEGERETRRGRMGWIDPCRNSEIRHLSSSAAQQQATLQTTGREIARQQQQPWVSDDEMVVALFESAVRYEAQ